MADEENYTIEAFTKKYSLPEHEAGRLFNSFGPRKIDLDILMKGKMERALWQAAPVASSNGGSRTPPRR